MTLDRIDDRKLLLAELDRLPRLLDARRAHDGLDPFAKLAIELVASGQARRAFDLNEESTATRERYGLHRWGQMALLARRLVEAGVTFVTLNTAPDCLRWDCHANIVREKRPQPGPGGPNVGMELNGPPLDRALAALVADLTERDACRDVLLVVWGEFGRSPRINAAGGRDHWPRLGNVLFAGRRGEDRAGHRSVERRRRAGDRATGEPRRRARHALQTSGHRPQPERRQSARPPDPALGRWQPDRGVVLRWVEWLDPRCDAFRGGPVGMTAPFLACLDIAI